MVDIQSKEVIDKISDELKIQPAFDIPREISKNIQLVYNVNPDKTLNRTITSSRLASGAFTVLTTPLNKDFFLTGVYIGMVKNATCDVASGFVALASTIDGQSISLVRIPIITLLAQETSTFISFNPPLKLDRGVTITFASSTFAAGAMSRTATFTAYETDPL